MSVFETSVQAYPKRSNTLKHTSSETLLSQRSFEYARTKASSMLALKLCSRNIGSSTLAAKLQVLSQQSLEHTRSLDRTRSFATTIVGASPIRVGRSFHTLSVFVFSATKQAMVLGSLTACRGVLIDKGVTVRGPCQTSLKGAQTSP